MENRRFGSTKWRLRSGFTLLELLITVASISTVTSIAYVGLTNTSKTVNSVKLTQDVAALNRALRTYGANGGNVATINNGNEALARLKTIASTSGQARIAGLRGTMIDPRLRGVSTTSDGGLRAVWNDVSKSFAVREAGSGFKEFLLDAAPPVIVQEEERQRLLALNSEDKWIWKFEENATRPRGPQQTATGQPVPVVNPYQPAALAVLQSPVFTRPGGLYDFQATGPRLSVPLQNPNPDATSEVYYSISNGPWLRYDGTPLQIPHALTTSIRAYSAPLDPDRYEISAVTSATYETIYFAGNSAGLFADPAGDHGLISNLLGGLKNPYFEWGSPALDLGFISPNTLEFKGASFDRIAPDQLFELGTLTYYNGTTFSGTNASSVELEVLLNLTTPGAVERLPFTFKLLSTKNTKADLIAKGTLLPDIQLEDQDADYVYIPDVSTKFETKIKGRPYYLVLSFGSSSKNGFTTINEFHTHENKTMTGSIFGRFTTKPPSGKSQKEKDDDDDDEDDDD